MLAVILGLFVLTVNAAQVNGHFKVTVNLQALGASPNTTQNSAFCRSTNAPGSFGATVTVVCATGAVVDISSVEPPCLGRPCMVERIAIFCRLAAMVIFWEL